MLAIVPITWRCGQTVMHNPVRRCEYFTADLHRLANWLRGCGVKTVALQSTGVYWIPLYDILEERGFEVYLVNARHTKNLPGRKSDVQESQWLLKLHTYGLLNNSFQPPSKIRMLRTRHGSGDLCAAHAESTDPDEQLANVISDLSGVTGQLIVRAIVGGERDPWKLTELSHPRIQASRAEIAKAWRATGAKNSSSYCNRKWRCMTPTFSVSTHQKPMTCRRVPTGEQSARGPMTSLGIYYHLPQRRRSGRSSAQEHSKIRFLGWLATFIPRYSE